MVDPTSGTVAPNGYRLLLPPGWVRVPLRDGTDRTLEDLVFSRLRELPAGVSRDDGMKYRLMVRRAVTDQIAQARRAGGLDLYLPLTVRHGAPLAASFLVCEVDTGAQGAVPPEAVLAQLAATDGDVLTATQELAGTFAVRREYLRPAAPERDVRLATRHVEYALPVPYDPRRFLSVAFSTPGDGDVDSDFTRAVAELFDAVMTTFHWTRGGVDLELACSEGELSPT